MNNTDVAIISETLSFSVDQNFKGQRLDAFLADRLSDKGLSRSRLKDLLSNGLVRVNGKSSKPSYRLRGDEQIELQLPESKPLELTPECVDFTIIHEDEDLLVISKPPALVVHPACGHQSGTLVHGLLFHCNDLSGISGVERPGIVHRLDMDTSGALVVAKNDFCHNNLVNQFKERQVEKIYRAIVTGIPEKKSGRITAPIGRHQNNRRKMAIDERNGRPSVTNWQRLEDFSQGLSYIEIKLETGRTHQIRVHMASIGHPVAGDDLYGRKNAKIREELSITRQCLHSYKLSFTHPRNEEQMSFTAPLWPDIENTLAFLRSKP